LLLGFGGVRRTRENLPRITSLTRYAVANIAKITKRAVWIASLKADKFRGGSLIPSELTGI